MKHAYKPGCTCARCAREATRRDAQSRADTTRKVWPAVRYRGRNARREATRRPIVGSAEWAETRGDDLGDSPDY